MRKWGGSSGRAFLSLFFGFSSIAFAQTAPEPHTLSVGASAISQPHLPFGKFQEVQTQFSLREISWPRNNAQLWTTPLPTAQADLPQVIFLGAGRFADDVRQLADRNLLVPVDGLLKELGIAAEEFPPEARKAFTRRGTLWAIPSHAAFPVLRYNRQFFDTANAPPPIASWEELFSTAASLITAREATGAKRGLSVPGTAARFAEFIALSAGAPPFDLAEPELLTSPQFETALRLVLDAKAKRKIIFRREFTPMPTDAGFVFGLDYVDCVGEGTPFGILPSPRKVATGDAEAAQSRVLGSLEGIVVRRHSPDEHESVLAFLKWILDPETESLMLESTLKEKPSKDWLLDSVHVPMAKSTLATALKGHPELAELEAQMSNVVFPCAVPALEAEVWEMVEACVDYYQPGTDLTEALADLKKRVVERVRNAQVDTVAYRGY